MARLARTDPAAGKQSLFSAYLGAGSGSARNIPPNGPPPAPRSPPSTSPAPRRQARPLTVAEIRRILRPLNPGRPGDVRDAAIILLDYAGALRRSEIAGLTLAGVERKSAGILLTLRRSKTDPEARGQVIGIAHGDHPITDPVRVLDAWRGLRGHEPGPLFTRVYSSRVHATGLSGSTLSRMLQARAAAAGLPAERIAAHSLRAGHAITAALAGIPLERIPAQTRHRDLSVLVERYLRPLEALAQAPGAVRPRRTPRRPQRQRPTRLNRLEPSNPAG